LQDYLGHDGTGYSASFQAQRTFIKSNSSISNALPNALTAGHILCLAIDLGNNKMWGRVDNNAWSGTSGNPATNTAGQDIASVNDAVGVYLGFSTNDHTSVFDKATLSLGPSFTYTAPSGFLGWDAGASAMFSYPSPYRAQLRHRLIR